MPPRHTGAAASTPACPDDCTSLYASAHLAHNFTLASACPDVPFSYHAGGKEPTPRVLDYIFYTPDRLEVVPTGIPLFTEEDSFAHGALPNPRIPSDHIALLVDFVQKV